MNKQQQYAWEARVADIEAERASLENLRESWSGIAKYYRAKAEEAARINSLRPMR